MISVLVGQRSDPMAKVHISLSNSIGFKPSLHLGPVHMVKKGHIYVTLLQINIPRVMNRSQKLRKFI